MRANEFLTELWTQPYELTSRVIGPASLEYYFDTKDNRSGRIVFDSSLDSDQGGTHVVLVIVHFYIDNLYHTSGKGDAVAIFSTVVAACRDYLRRYRPPVVTFETPDAKKRNLYVRMTGMFPDYVIYPYLQWVHDPIVGDEIVDSLMDDNANDAIVLRRRDYVPEKTRLYVDEQGVAEGLLNEIYKMPPTKNSSQGLADWAYNDAVKKNAEIIFQDSNTVVFQVGADMIRYIILSEGQPIFYLGLTKFLDGWKSGVVAAETEARGQGLATKIYLQASDLLKQPIYSDTTQTDASRLGIWNKLIQMVPSRVVGFDQKTNNDLPLTMTKDGPVVNQNQPLYIDRNKKDSEKPVTQQQRYRTRILKLLPNKQGVAEGTRQQLDFDSLYGKVFKITDNNGNPNNPGFSIVTPLNGESWNWRERPEFKKIVKQKLNDPAFLGDHKYQQIIDAMAGNKFDTTKHTVKQGVAESFGGRKFVKPNFDFEWEEAERYPEFVKLGKDAWIELARKGRAVVITSAQDINNTDAADPDNFKLLHPEKQKRALAQLETGTVEMPVVAVYSDGRKELVGGNTRLTAMMAQDGQATVWAFRVPDNILENFADGKVKGKSRPGRVKRAGASCNGSVTDLRKRAKNASGERAKMYHWCANMKSGKKK